MAFRILAIGIDRYRSPLVTDLSCSVRDARALYALFTDGFGNSGSVLLENDQATRLNIVSALENLQQVNSDDVVVISFSGHGSDSHHLITHDADPILLDSTALHLDELTDLFSKIPATNLLLLLDCCFAGGAGAKVFHAPIATKAAASAAALLQRISGKGRVIFTAASADQEAIEDRRRGHGLFTFYVLEGLRGAPEVVTAGRVPVLSLLEFVTKSVVNAAAQIRHEQEPAIRGSVEGELVFPILTPGPAYAGFFPQRAARAVGSDVDDLAAFGFPLEIREILRAAIPGMNELQQEAINHCGLFDEQHLVVSAPTSSGKTMIGELAALHGYTKGDRTYMLLPMRALVNDKYDEFTAKYGGFGIRIVRSTGEISDDDDALFRGKFDIALLTYERFAAIALTMPHILRQVGIVVVDEVQMITDNHRGANLEFILTLLNAQRKIGIEPQIIALSAVIGATNGFESWLAARLLSSDKRPVPLDEGMIDMSGTFRFIDPDGKEGDIAGYVQREYRKGSSQDLIIPLARKLMADGEKIIVFRETKPRVQATAAYLSNNLGLPPAAETIAQLPVGDPSAASGQLRQCLQGGVGFHFADLDREEKQALEVTFRDPQSSLRILVATTTLAMGVNTPAWSVVIAGLDHPDAPYTVAEYKNMVGRAGRLGFTPKGKSFAVAPSAAEAYKLWERYVRGKPEALFSRFSEQDPLSLLCRVLATATGAKVTALSKEDLTDFIQSTFAAYQKQSALSDSAIANALARLVDAGLVEQIDDRYRLTDLGKVAGELGIQVESVVRIARGLKGLTGAEIVDRVILATAQTTVELDDIIFPIHKTSTQERQRWQGAVYGQHLPGSVLREMQSTDAVGYTARCKRLASVLMWVDGVELNRLEASLLKHLPGNNAAGAIRGTAERTRDLIGVVARIGDLVSVDKAPVAADVDTLAVRLELGIPAELVWLARGAKRGLERGDYLALRRASLQTLDQINAADDKSLQQCVGTAVKVRRIREAVSKVPPEMAEGDSDLPMPTPVDA